jgi:hypothetical protein
VKGPGFSLWVNAATETDQYHGLVKVNPAPPRPERAQRPAGLPPRYQNITPTQAQIARGMGTDAAEPSIGVNLNSGNIFFQAILQTLRVRFDDSCPSTPTATWQDKSSVNMNQTSFDPILYTDHETGRTQVSQSILGSTESIIAYTDDDGATWRPWRRCGSNPTCKKSPLARSTAEVDASRCA